MILVPNLLQKLLKDEFQYLKIPLAWINHMDEVKAADYKGALVITTDTANTILVPNLLQKLLKDEFQYLKIPATPKTSLVLDQK